MQSAESYTAPEGELRALMPHQMRPFAIEVAFAGIVSSAMRRLFAPVFLLPAHQHACAICICACFKCCSWVTNV